LTLNDMYEKLIEEYKSKTIGSKLIYERTLNVLPAGVTYAIRSLTSYPFYVKKASGPYIWDVDDNKYVDYWMGHGALILGHSFKPIVKAIKEQVELGSHYGYAHKLEVELAELVSDIMPKRAVFWFYDFL